MPMKHTQPSALTLLALGSFLAGSFALTTQAQTFDSQGRYSADSRNLTPSVRDYRDAAAGAPDYRQAAAGAPDYRTAAGQSNSGFVPYDGPDVDRDRGHHHRRDRHRDHRRHSPAILYRDVSPYVDVYSRGAYTGLGYGGSYNNSYQGSGVGVVYGSDTAVSNTPPVPLITEARASEGWDYLAAGQARAALTAFAQTTLESPHDAQARVGYALAAALDNQWGRAEWAMQRALEDDAEVLETIAISPQIKVQVEALQTEADQREATSLTRALQTLGN